MGNTHPNALRKSPRDSGQSLGEGDDHSDSFDLKSIPNNELYMFRKSYEESSGAQSNRTSSEQALKICMENPNCTSDLCKSIDKQALMLRQEYRAAMIRGIANISDEVAEVPMDSSEL